MAWKKPGDKPSSEDMENLVSHVQGRKSKVPAKRAEQNRQKRKDNPGELTKKFGMGRTERENVLGKTMAHQMRADFMDAKKRGVSMEDVDYFNDFAEFLMDEEWKPFPKDKVNRQIEKKRAINHQTPHRQAHEMQAIKNYRTRMTDTSKARQHLTGKDLSKSVDKESSHRDKSKETLAKENKQDAKNVKHLQKAEKYRNEGDKKNEKKHNKKALKHDDKSYKHSMERLKHTKRARGMSAVRFTDRRNSLEDDRKQAEHNRKDKAARATARAMLAKTNAEAAYKKPAVKGASKGGFKKEDFERLNFTQYLEATQGIVPDYTVEGETPKCPPGYKWNMKSKRCEPKSEKDSVSDSHKKDNEPRNAPGYNVWGHTGVNGDGYAWAEPNNWGDSSASGSGGGVA